MNRIYTDRSRSLIYRRCPRLRWLEYAAGSAKVGLSPKKKSIHLLIGGAVHAGLEVLLTHAMEQPSLDPLGPMNAREVEDLAAKIAVEELRKMSEFGVEVDSIEKL